MSISFIVITYNSEKTILDCLDSIEQNFPSWAKLSFVLIDNNSQDSSQKLLAGAKEKHKNSCRLIFNKENLGFAKAVNQGIRLSQKHFEPDFFFLFNPDATMGKDTISELLHFCQNKTSPFLASPIIVDPKTSRPWFCGGKIDYLKQKTTHFQKTLPNSKQVESDFLSGCALLIPKRSFEKIGFFDESLFLYYEDADFCVRAKKANIETFVVPSAKCFHSESQSFEGEQKCFHLVKSGLLFFHKHYPLICKPYFWTIFLLRFAFHRLVSKKQCVLKGMKSFLNKKNLPNTNNSI